MGDDEAPMLSEHKRNSPIEGDVRDDAGYGSWQWLSIMLMVGPRQGNIIMQGGPLEYIEIHHILAILYRPFTNILPITKGAIIFKTN